MTLYKFPRQVVDKDVHPVYSNDDWTMKWDHSPALSAFESTKWNGSFGSTVRLPKRESSPIVVEGLSERFSIPMIPRQPNKLMLAGDWHGNLPWAFKAMHYAKSQGADTILQLGDFGWWQQDNPRTHQYLREVQKELKTLGLLLYWVDGNHEDHSYLGKYNEPGKSNEPRQEPWCLDLYDRIVHLPRGYRWEWWGDTWMSLGGATSVDQTWALPYVDWWPGEKLTNRQYRYACRPGPVDIIVAHDAPSGVKIPGVVPGKDLWLQIDGQRRQVPAWVLGEVNAHRDLVQGVCDRVKPLEFYHGHYHKSYSALARTTGGGYMNVRGLDKDGTTMTANTHFVTGGLTDGDGGES